MTTPQALQIRRPQQLLALALSALVTTAVVGGLLGPAEADRAALLAQHLQTAPQAIAQMLQAPLA